ncbi:N-acetyl-gamma-glutamyl-phosphate reductase [Mesobacillus harenae]|uniref:N-acetyl-gamma-glutamyl-phosphate reductase n=1 Tax=Mesobacillus harenae TaxID=2213203 RepID=UPI0015808113|nr:N-acetyl-gamma-glutamyl-phosphate reductase [Mesobacillus harenae]
MKVSIIGTTGYGGGELIRLLRNHPIFTIHSIHTTRDEVPISDEYPHLSDIFEKRLEKVDPEKIAEQSQIVFLATPSGISGKLAASFADKNIQVVDLSGDLRLKNPEDYESWYKREPAAETLVSKAVYGLSEWNRESIQKSTLVANPGCFPTATLLGLAPVTIQNVINPASIIIDAKTGVSGAGRSLSKGMMFAEVNENLRIYKVNEHQHTPEIEQQLKLWNSGCGPITFNTHLLPITRGIMTTMYVQLTDNLNTAALIDLYKETYKDQPFVRIRKNGIYPSVKEVSGSNYCDIGLNADSRTGRLTIVSVIDNLMKGAAGQAVQNANIMNGLPETTGLEIVPLYP